MVYPTYKYSTCNSYVLASYRRDWRPTEVRAPAISYISLCPDDSHGEDLKEDLPISSASPDDGMPHIEESWLVSMKVRVPVNILHILLELLN